MHSAQFELHAQIEERHWWFVARRRILQTVVHELVSPGRGATLVDIGCGTGANLGAFASGYRCVGIDTSPLAIELAHARFPAVKFLCGFAPQDLGEEIHRAELFLLTDVLEHVEDDCGLLANLVDAVRPGAKLLITVPADVALWSEHDVSFGHFRRYDRQRFLRSWQDLPVEVELISAFNSRLYPIVKAVRSWNRFRRKSSGAAGTDFSMPSDRVNRLLTRIFAGERHRLSQILRGEASRGFDHGVSLMAVLRKKPQPVQNPKGSGRSSTGLGIAPVSLDSLSSSENAAIHAPVAGL